MDNLEHIKEKEAKARRRFDRQFLKAMDAAEMDFATLGVCASVFAVDMKAKNGWDREIADINFGWRLRAAAEWIKANDPDLWRMIENKARSEFRSHKED